MIKLNTMFFTQEDYRKIERWLLANSRKDTEFALADTPLKGNETLAFVQDGANVRVSLKDLIDQIFLLGVSDFLNIADKYNASFISLEDAIQLIPYKSRKIGQVITFIDTVGNWRVFQFQGTSKNQWNTISLWIDIITASSQSNLETDEEDTTTVAVGNRSLIKFADKEYDTTSYSGLGKVYLRKNIKVVIDSITGAQKQVNLLTQDMVSKENTIYVLQYDYTLNATTVSVPDNSTIIYDGGSIDNGNLVFNNTVIIGKQRGTAVNSGTYIFQDTQADEEDITQNKLDILKFKDREYSPSNFSGLGRKILRKNISDGKNLLTQSMINLPNTVYEIRYDFDLDGENINLPINCVLKFNGGKISNGKLIGEFVIDAPLTHIFKDIDFSVRYKYSLFPQWFGAVGDGVNDDLDALQKCFKLSSSPYVPDGDYRITNTLHIVWDNTHVNLSPNATIFCQHKTRTGIYGNGGATISFHGFDPNRPAGDIVQDNYVDVSNVGISGGHVWNDNSLYSSEETNSQPDNENAISFVHTIDWHVYDVIIDKCNRKGITSQYKCINGVIKKCKVSDSGFSGIAIEGQSSSADNIVIENCVISLSSESRAETATLSQHRPIDIYGYKHIQISNTTIKSFDNDGIYLDVSGQLLLYNNIFESAQKRAAVINSINGAENIHVDSCKFINVETEYTYLFNKSDKCSFNIYNSVFGKIKSSLSSQKSYGISFSSCEIKNLEIDYPLSPYILIGNKIEYANISNANNARPISFGNLLKSAYVGWKPFISLDMLLSESGEIVNSTIIGAIASPSEDGVRPAAEKGVMCYSMTKKIPMWKSDTDWRNALGMIPAPYTGTSYPTSSTGQLFYRTDIKKVTFNIDGVNWVDFFGRIPNKTEGTTAERETITPSIGHTYWDTTLNKLLCYNGSSWVNADGTPLD